MENFSSINVKKLKENLFHLLDDKWMLITAGSKNNFNMMTASWGAFGILWNKPIAIVFIRHNRYTLNFIEENDLFSLSFFPGKYREILELYGTKSGKEIDKMNTPGLTPIFTENNGIYYEEANLVFICDKIYFSDITNEIPMAIKKQYYPDNIFHKMFIGKIKSCLKKTEEIR